MSSFVPHKRFRFLALVALALFSLPLFVAGVSAIASDKIPDKAEVKPVGRESVTHAPFVVTLGKAEVISIDVPFSDVLVADPSIVDVSALNTSKLYLVGTKIGDTNIIILDDTGDIVRRIDVHVTYDLQMIQSTVEKFFPDEDITVKALHDQIVLTGTASNPEKAQRITDLVGTYMGDLIDEEATPDELIVNMLEVQGEQQVMLRVKIVEASRSILKELGIETGANDPASGPIPGSGDVAAQFLTGSQIGLTQDPLGMGQIITDSGVTGIGFLNVVVNALEQENLINTLAEPNLTAISGETAGFLAGGEFPVPVGRDQTGNIVIEFRPFGVSLNFRPTVLSADRVSLQLETEVSSLNFDDGVTFGGGTVTASRIPAFDVRRASTTVEMASGGSLMIAGLLSSSTTKGLSGLPGIKDTPVLGDLVKSDSFQRDESEVLIIVTPYLVKPTGDETNADLVVAKTNNPLAEMFAANIRKKYAIREDDPVFEDDLQFGYILD